MMLLVFLSVAEAGDVTLVVINFKGGNVNQEMGAAVSEVLRGVITAIDNKPYRIVERDQLNEVMKEQGLSLSGVVDESGSQKIGRVLSADFMIIGSITRLGNGYTINGRIVNTATGEVVRGYVAVASSENELPSRLTAMAYVLLGLKVPDTVQPPGPAGGEGRTVSPAETRQLTYNSWYTDASGMHQGGKIVLTVTGRDVTGQSIESYGTADMKGTLEGDRVVGYYKADYGYGNFEFTVTDGWKKLRGRYYQVSNGAKGEWSGDLE